MNRRASDRHYLMSRLGRTVACVDWFAPDYRAFVIECLQRHLRAEASLLSDLVTQRRNVRYLPRFGDLAVAKVCDHRLIDREASSRPLHPSEARTNRAGDDDTSHLDVAVHHDLLDVVAKIGHGCQRIPPHGLLGLGTRRGESDWRVDYCVGMEEIVEGVELTSITSGKPPEHHRGA
jgi:hypothetical protein